ncbi:DcaP-like protein [Acinetobacter sp. ANC 4633]|uniref:DcaP family trimeric outer membrane transporter n=1 Tax=Acinetobacter sp. ANC 4633 TaxID=2529845 RepID=UPI00103F8DBD|nr:DcaP family trimeric outer membrane transporter [Acinetobacter sp. ANC 4633]TCB28927.1 DcaP-like protein [Acinetobacter sp. ANC 4633]
MIKVKTLALSVSAALAWGAIGSAQAATTTQQVADLKAQVSELQQMVQSLSSQQQQQAVQLQQQAEIAAAKPAPVAPTASSTKPGWITLADGQTQLKVYGSVRADSTYDTKGGNSDTTSITNNTNKVPLNSAHGTRNNLNVTAATSRLGVDVVRPTQYGDLTGKLEADFMGSSSTNGDGSFRVRHAYLSLGKWLVGQTTSPFVNVDTMPETVDYNGAMGGGTKRNVQVRYTQPITANQKVLVALEGGDADKLSTTSGTIGAATASSGGNRLPALTARYDIATADKKGLLQVHGMLHENRISAATATDNTGTNIDKTKLGWGVGVGGKYSFTPNDTVFANYYHVKGDNRYMFFQNDAYVASRVGTDLHIGESEFDSGLLGYSHKWSPKFRSTVAAGAIWYKNDSTFAKLAPTQNKNLYNIIVNSFYTPVKDVDLGVEYTYGQRETFASSTATTDNKGDYSRVGLMARYNF